MIDKKKRRKIKGKLTEDDTVSLVQRYGATTILILLQEVAQSADVKIDWKRIVKRSSTGISNPREYQLLWRHLAYREPLLEKIDGAEPTDDDSDLDFELEAVPAVRAEDTSHAAAFVKGLMPRSFSSDSGPQNDSALEVRSALETSNGPASNTSPSGKEDAAPSVSRKTITPVSLHKQMVSTGPPNKGFEGYEVAGAGSANKKRRAEGLEGNEIADAALASKKKRKLWTEEEDTELIAAVQKFGEGNWVTILKEDFKHDRTASQLSQRWSILKKRRANSNTGWCSNPISFAQSEALDATRLALTSALNMPMARSFSVINAGATQSTTPSNISTFSSTVSESLCRPSHSQSPNLLPPSNLQEAPDQAAAEKGNVIPSNKPQSNTTSSLIKAAAFAAGGRIVAPSAVASLFQAVQSKNVVHIRAGGSQLTSTVNKGRQPSASQHSRPHMMPPPPVNSLMISNGYTVPSHKKRGNSNFLGKSSVAGAQQRSSSLGNGEKVSGNKTSASDADGGSSPEVVEGGEKIELDGVLNQDQKGSLEVGEKDTRMGKDVDITAHNSNV